MINYQARDERGNELSDVIDFGIPRQPTYSVGLDIGSTTTKAVVLDPQTHDVLYSTYRRHFAHQVESLETVVKEVFARFPDRPCRFSMSGSGSKGLAAQLGIPYIQEVVANATAVQKLYPHARCAIELGGQDAKMIFFERDGQTGAMTVTDMRMNGSCAGGTGAFIDEIAALLKIDVERLDDAAAAGCTVYDISGRCGVYAKTDIQPLLNAGARKEDLALSTFHAIAKQTLGGLAQGLDIRPPVIFEGGPLTFNPHLIGVFAEHLGLSAQDIIHPKRPETIVALGAAFALEGMFAHADAERSSAELLAALAKARRDLSENAASGTCFFQSAAERRAFEKRHRLPTIRSAAANAPGSTVRAYLGIDSGSTTTKFALVDETGQLVDAFYATNEGEPLDIAVDALKKLASTYNDAGVKLEILGCATTGYGEALFAHAFHADQHMVETVAHARAAVEYDPQASFVLDIGGQDMKAIWLEDGVVTDIVVNEACSSGCGSFLQGFAQSLNIRMEDIASAAFDAEKPAQLGSRCTVFMNSSVVTEQKNGKTANDIMAGLCRSIVENVFTKVVRVSNLDSLGDHIVVQGGTFRNDAVLAAFEDYIGKPVTRAPYPGLMGAIGAALLVKAQVEEQAAREGSYMSTFIGLEALDAFSYRQRSNMTCQFCGNACARTLVTFSDGTTFVTGNRCERGSVVGDLGDAKTRAKLKQMRAQAASVPNLFKTREELLFKEYPCTPVLPDQHTIVGLPRVLALWDQAPFWTTLLRALGFTPRLSHLSTRACYEEGLPSVASDTVCFPAKLVHGHLRDLARQGVDRIFMPVVTTVPTENRQDTSVSMCAVVKGYPLVIRNSDNPERRFGIPFDSPLFHWYSTRDMRRQLRAYLKEAFGIAPDVADRALEQARAAQAQFKGELVAAGRDVLSRVELENGYAIVLASRPYHNDPLVNHDIDTLITSLGIPVLPPDAIPGVNDVDLRNSLIDVVNNFHARMLGSAVIAASCPHLEYVQLVSFGCGHDAYLSDEIVRIMHEVGGKSPLVLKVDESDAAGPLKIRVRSFVETIDIRRREQAAGRKTPAPVRPLEDPYHTKFEKADRKRRVILVPNTSHAFSMLMAAVFSKQGVQAVSLDIGREEAIALGKRYVHNDICFPAQIVIGELLSALKSGKFDDAHVAVGQGKYIGDCRLTHYTALTRKALDDAGFADVPIITNDDVDFHNVHPGFKMSVASAIRVAMGLPMIDIMEELLRKTRPYELEQGSAQRAFDAGLQAIVDGMRESGVHGAKRGFKKAIELMKDVSYDRSRPRPTVLIVGEYLLNFHPGANREIERYLEASGFEIIEARMTDVIRKTYFYKDAQVKEYKVDAGFSQAAWFSTANALFEHAHDVADRIASAHPLYTPVTRMGKLVKASDPIIHHTFDAGEGVLIPAEILEHAAHGCNAFLILQPFGCLPNHVVGRGIAKRLKELYPKAQILPLDYDPDVSFANLENRLQMLIMNARREVDPTVQGTQPPRIIGNVIHLDEARELPHTVAGCMAAVHDLNSSFASLYEKMKRERTPDLLSRLRFLLNNATTIQDEADELAAYAQRLARRIDEVTRAAVQNATARDAGERQRISDVSHAASEIGHLTSLEIALWAEQVHHRSSKLEQLFDSEKPGAAERLKAYTDEVMGLSEKITKRAEELGTRAAKVSEIAAQIN